MSDEIKITVEIPDSVRISTDQQLVTIRSEGVQGPPGPGAQEVREELDRIIDLSLLFNNALI